MSEYECEHGRRIGKCADCEIQELQGELSDLEGDYKTEFNAAEDLRCVVEDKDQQIKKLTEALTDVIDGETKYDLVDITGLSLERCDEIIQLLAEIKG